MLLSAAAGPDLGEDEPAKRDRGEFVSEATVKTHVARILAKLDLRDRAQAIIAAYETGLVQPGR